MHDAKSNSPISQLMLPQQGRNQDQRLPEGLLSDYVNIDERSSEDFFALLKALSVHLHFHSADDQTPNGDWSSFFPFEKHQAEQWIKQNKGKVPPHLALLKTFLDAYRDGPHQQLNSLKQKYLDYYYKDVLNFSKSDIVPERAHLIVTLRKQSPALLIKPEHQLIAGKREDKSVILAAPVTEALINHCQVVEKRSIYSHPSQPGQVRVAPVADSADGLGAPFDDTPLKWHGFGHPALPVREIGFALSSKLLLLNEGERDIHITLKLGSTITDNELEIAELFKVYLSTQEGWTEEKLANASFSGSDTGGTVINISLRLDESEPAITAYHSALHGFQLDTTQPVIQLLLNTDISHSVIGQLLDTNIVSSQIRVSASDVKSLTLVSDSGNINPSQSFMPFGAQPVSGSILKINSSEVFDKHLDSLTINLGWKSPHDSLRAVYEGYELYTSMPGGINNRYFTANVKALDGEGHTLSASDQPLFHASDASVSNKIKISTSAFTSIRKPGVRDYARKLSSYQSQWANKRYATLSKLRPELVPVGRYTREPVASLSSKRIDKGLQLTLNQSFFHQDYRRAYVKNVLAVNDNPELSLIAEPYTPELNYLSLDYEASSRVVSFSDSSESAFSDDEIHFFHLDCFGQRREHAYQRSQLDYVTNKQVTLLPEHQDQGELLLGLSQINAGDSCQLLFQVAQGSSDPDLIPEKIHWSVLCDNYWKALTKKELVFEKSNGLLTSGLVKLIIPTEATVQNTLLPSGLIWLKLAINKNVSSVCQLQEVVSNAIEVASVPATNPTTYDALPAGSISKLRDPLTEVKSVQQPYNGFGGKKQETDDHFNARVSERLRHKNRALSIYDYETLVLQQFTNLYRVKAIPHTKPVANRFNWQAPGHVTFLLLPDSFGSRTNAVDPLRPLTDSLTIDQVRKYLGCRTAMQAKVHVMNPEYLQVRLSFKVQFREGFEFNYYREQLSLALTSYLSPWLSEESSGPEFGGRIYKSVVMEFIEKIPYVDFISHVLLQTTLDGTSFSADSCHVSATTPVQILTSAAEHVIEEAEYE